MRSIIITTISLAALLPTLAAACDFPPPESVMIRGANGCVQLMVELAREPEQLSCGLSGRDHLAEDHGMLFDFRDRTAVSMWMRNTRIPLDMVFIDSNGKVIAIHYNAEPYSEDIISGPHGTAAVLELLAGAAESHGLVAGSVVQHLLFPRTLKEKSCNNR